MSSSSWACHVQDGTRSPRDNHYSEYSVFVSLGFTSQGAVLLFLPLFWAKNDFKSPLPCSLLFAALGTRLAIVKECYVVSCLFKALVREVHRSLDSTLLPSA